MAAANPMRGEAPLGAHKLVIDFNGFCALEQETGLKVPDLIGRLADGLGFAELRTWIRIFLDTDVADEEAGELVGEQGVESTLKALAKAVDGFFGSPKKGKAPNPPIAE